MCMHKYASSRWCRGGKGGFVMRYTGHFVVSFFVLLGVVSTLPAEETQGWRPKDGVQPPAVLTNPVVDLQDSFDWQDDLYGPLIDHEVEQVSTAPQNHSEKWCSCPTCERCGKVKPGQASYTNTPESKASEGKQLQFAQSEQPLLQRLRFAVQALTELR